MKNRRIGKRGLGVAMAIGVLAATVLTVGAGIALADDGDDGGSARVTSASGSVTVPPDGTGATRRLPLTQVTVSGVCDVTTPTPPIPPSVLARAIVQAADGRTLDGFSPGSGAVGGTSLTTAPFAFGTVGGIGGLQSFGTTTLIVTSNRATATITIGGRVDPATGACTFLWQAVESRNS